MTIVRFAYLCDKCNARSPEYSSWPTCRECGADVCTACTVPGTASEDEANEATCKECREGTWEKHQVGCDWLWDAEQDCTCKKLGYNCVDCGKDIAYRGASGSRNKPPEGEPSVRDRCIPCGAKVSARSFPESHNMIDDLLENR